MNETPKAEIRPRSMPSAIWLLPLLAALIAAWLVYKHYQEQGVMIEVVFNSAEGLEANKTPLLYKGLPSGTLRQLELNDDLKTVTAHIEVEPQAERLLTAGTEFWLVRPEISLSGVRGLETLLSGYYIAMRPGDHNAAPRSRFLALKEPAAPLQDEAGLYISLSAPTAQSLHRGSPVYYRQINVGEVLDYSLAPEGDRVLIDLFIDPSYSHLVRSSSRFWNASGVKVKTDLPDVEVQFDSLASIIAGGVHFYTPDTDASLATNGDAFKLYRDYEAAENGLDVLLQFPPETELSIGTPVISQGIQIGRVRDLQHSDNLQALDAQLVIDPRAKELLREGSRFWLTEPAFSLANPDLRQLFKGSQIELIPGQGKPAVRFIAQQAGRAGFTPAHGLPITVIAEQRGSLNKGSPILYRELPVGRVTGVELAPSGEKVLIHGVIRESYRHLLKRHSRFWNTSGLRIQASLEGVDIQTPSARTLLAGGLSFFTPDWKDAQEARRGERYRLYESFKAASKNGRLLYKNNANTLALTLNANQLGSLGIGAPVLYKQLPVGKVTSYRLNPETADVEVDIQIQAAYRKHINRSSRFWIASGVKAKADLNSGFQLETQSLQSLLTGGIAFSTPDEQAAQVKPGQHFKLYRSEQASQEQSQPLVVHFPPGHILKDGAPLLYQGLQVGRVEQVELQGPEGDIKAHIALFRSGAFLRNAGSRFWIVEPLVTLSRVENPANILLGNHIAALAGTGQPRLEHQGLAQAPADSRPDGLQLVLEAERLGSIEKGSPVFYRQLPVGKVTGFDLTANRQKLEVYLYIEPKYAHLVNNASQFWNVSGLRAEIGLFSGVKIQAETLETLVGGGVAFSSPVEGTAVKAGRHFTLLDQPPEPKR